AQHPTIG
ncbi:hypothetical protein D049_0324B, partial [Vibrio parahaemolyticus VPTS-2010]